jgi:hypothetical protein
MALDALAFGPWRRKRGRGWPGKITVSQRGAGNSLEGNPKEATGDLS